MPDTLNVFAFRPSLKAGMKVECSCGETATVETEVGSSEEGRAELLRRGWWRKRGGWLCPDCMEELD